MRHNVNMRHPVFEILNKMVPPFAFPTFINIAERLRFHFSGFSKNFKRNIELKDIAQEKEAFLLATGPSIKKQDLRKLQGRQCISAGNFFLHKDIDLLNPQYHCVPGFHPPLIPENFVDFLSMMDRKLPEATKIISGHKNKSLIDENHLFASRDVYYVYHSLEKHNGKLDFRKPVPAPRNGSFMVITVLLYMGFKKIYLLGCDNNRILDYGKVMRNFYSPEEDIRQNSTNVWRTITLDVKNLYEEMKQFDYLNDLAKNHYEAEILNLSPTSWLHMFKYVDFKDIK